MDALQIPPNDIEIEEGIIGGLLLDAKLIYLIREELKPEKFYIHSHQIICRAILDLADKGKVVDLMTVAVWLSDHHLLEQVGGQPKLVQLLERTVSSINVDQYTPLLHEKYLRRKIINSGHKLINLAHKTEMEIEEVKTQSYDVVSNVLDEELGQTSKPKALCTALETLFDRLSSGQTTGYKTGLLDLDELIQYRPSQMIVVAGRPGMGKTWCGCFITLHLARTYNKPVVFFTAEMSEEEISGRFLAMESGVDSERIDRNEVQDDEWPKLIAAIERLSQYPIILDSTPADKLSVARMKAVLTETQMRFGQIGGVILDYVQLIADTNKYGNQQNLAVAAISKGCKSLAQEFKVPFFPLSQLSRSSESRTDKRPTLSDLRDSGQIEQDANIVIGLYRDEYYNPDTSDKGVCEFIVLKHRGGKTGTAKVLFNPAIGGYANLKRFNNGY